MFINQRKTGLPLNYGLNIRKMKQPVPLQELYMNCSVQDSLVSLSVFQTYKNTTKNPIEVEYVFPVDSNSAVCSLKVQRGSEIIEGVIEEKEEAKEQYEDIMSQGNSGLIAEYDKDDSQDRMVLNIGNMQADEQMTVIISYIGVCGIEQQKQVVMIPCALTPKYDMISETEGHTKVSMQSKAGYKIKIDCEIKCQNKQILGAESLHHKIVKQQQTAFH